jgi:hypothetical protein
MLNFGQWHLRMILADMGPITTGAARGPASSPPRPDHPPASLFQQRIQQISAYLGMVRN